MYQYNTPKKEAAHWRTHKHITLMTFWMKLRPRDNTYFKALCLLMQQHENWTKIPVFWDVMPHWLVVTDILRAKQPKQAVHGRIDTMKALWSFKPMVTIRQSTQCYLQEDLKYSSTVMWGPQISRTNLTFGCWDTDVTSFETKWD